MNIDDLQEANLLMVWLNVKDRFVHNNNGWNFSAVYLFPTMKNAILKLKKT